MNKTIAMYLRCMTDDRPRTWLDWLPWAEFCYNTAYHLALQTTPFQVVYGRLPPVVLPYQPERRARTPSTPCWRTEMPSSPTSAHDSSKLRNTPDVIMTHTTATCRSLQAIGHGCGFSIDRRSRSY